jgi:hypothetical protein
METRLEKSSMITVEKIAKDFKIVSKELSKYEALSLNVNISDEETLNIAENNAAQIKTMMIRAEATRKALKEPYFNTAKAIDAYAKGITDKLDSFSKRFGLAISTWRTVQEAHKRAELEAKERSLKVIEEEKTAEIERLAKLTRTINAKLYGGVFQTKTGEKMAEGCQTEDDCQKLLETIKTSFPPITEFKYFSDQRDKVFQDGVKAISNHYKNLIELKSDVPGLKRIVQQKIEDNKRAAGLIIEETKEKLIRKVEIASEKEINEGKKEIKEAARGTRKILKFNVVNEDLVTREFLSVDTTKIRDWMEGQNESIKMSIQAGDQPIPGVEFYVEVTHIAK